MSEIVRSVEALKLSVQQHLRRGAEEWIAAGKHLRRGAEEWIAAGKDLIELRAAVAEGEWISTLKSISLPRSTAHRLIQIAEVFNDVPHVGHTDLSLRILAKLASNSTPEPVREEMISRAACGERITPEAIRESVVRFQGPREPRPLSPLAQSVVHVHEPWSDLMNELPKVLANDRLEKWLKELDQDLTDMGSGSRQDSFGMRVEEELNALARRAEVWARKIGGLDVRKRKH